MPTEPKQKAAAAPKAAPAPSNAEHTFGDADAQIPVEAFITDGSHAVGVAGLVADKPELRIAHHTRDEWAALLDDYLNSERP